MPEFIKHFFANKPIPPGKRVLGPVVSAVAAFFLPGSAQALNGQVVKGGCMMLGWVAMYSLAQANSLVYAVVRILQYIIMVVASSDAYFIASRMKLGEAVRTWSILFLDIQAPSESAAAASQKNGGLSTLITDVTVIDGTGTPPFRSDVLITGGVIGRIQPHIPQKEKGYTVVDGKDRILIPGFLNPGCCCESAVFSGGENTGAVRQGITTEILGQTGQSLAPIRESCQQIGRKQFAAVHGKPEKELSYSNTGMYLMELERLKYPVRTESMIGYGTLRSTVLGDAPDMPDEQELERLCSRVRSGLTSGARGISFGFAYPPCSLVADAELRAVFQTIGACGAAASAQLPLGERTLLSSLRRLGALALETGVPLLVTNLHALGADRELADELCRQVSSLRREGADITLAVTGLSRQPFGLAALTPPEMWNGAGETLFRCPKDAPGRAALLERTARALAAVGGAGAVTLAGPEPSPITLEQAAGRRGCTPEELVFSLLEQQDGAVTALLRTDDQAFMSRLIEEPFTCLCTDDVLVEQADYTVPYYLGRYVRDEKRLTMEEAVRRNTMAQAARLRLWDRGLIREGMTADLVLLRPELLPDRLDEGASRGISKVWICGTLQYDTEPTLNLNGYSRTKLLGIRMGD